MAVVVPLRLCVPVATQNTGGGANLRIQNIFGADVEVQPGSYYIPGTGNPAVSTADYYHIDGLYWIRPYDLNAMGTPGQTIAAASGRYFWVTSPDHPNDAYGWSDGIDMFGGFSSDPGVMPSKLQRLFSFTNTFADGGATFALYQAPWLQYNPDDASFPFYIYLEGTVISGAPARQHEQGYAKSADLATWTMGGPSHRTTAFGGWSSFQRVIRLGTNSWKSVGLSDPVNYAGFAVWTSTDAKTFTWSGSPITTSFNSRNFSPGASDEVTIGAQKWFYVWEDARSADGGMYVTRVAVDASYNVLSSPAPVRISGKYLGNYPGPTFLDAVSAYAENGIAHIYATHGFPPSSSNQGLTDGATYANGGGLWQQNVDYYTEIVDATAAADAAPVGVSINCASSTVTVSWLNALPNNTYRVYKGTSAATQATLVGDVTGTSRTDTPTTGQQWWYKVVTLNSGVEKASRVVHTYVSAGTALVNNHINRVIDDGGDVTTIDQTWLASVDSWLSSNGLTTSLLLWANPAFGVKKSGSTIQKVYCLGTTRFPARGGDLQPTTANTSYSATGMNGTVPGWTNGASNAYSVFGNAADAVNGRWNPIRRKTQITVAAAYKKAGTADGGILSLGQPNMVPASGIAGGGLGIQHLTGTPGTPTFLITNDSTKLTATATAANATAANIMVGTYDGTTALCYCNGAAGSGVTGLPANANLALADVLKGQIGEHAAAYYQPALVSGAKDSRWARPAVPTYNDSSASFSASDLIVLEMALSGALASSLTTLLRNRIGA